MSHRLQCAVCGGDVARDHLCTNRCCADCHARHCTPGGNTSPGHGINLERARSLQHQQSNPKE